MTKNSDMLNKYDLQKKEALFIAKKMKRQVVLRILDEETRIEKCQKY